MRSQYCSIRLGLDPFFEDLTNMADRVFYFEEGPRDEPRLTAKNVAKDEGSEDAGGVFVIRSRLKSCYISLEKVNPKQLEIEATEEMLADLYDIQIWEDDLILQHKSGFLTIHRSDERFWRADRL